VKTQFVALGLIVILMVAGPSVAPHAVQPHTAAQAHVEQNYGQLPLYFVENQGQMDERVAYYLQGSDKTIYFAPDGVTFALTERPATDDEERTLASRGESDPQSTIHHPPSEIQRWAVKLDFVGANSDVRPVAQDKTEAVISYFTGPQDQWHAGLPTYSRLVYPDLWPGIDLVYYGTVNRLKYEFVVRPGADPTQIQLAYRGATSVQINAAGQLEVTTPIGGFSDDTPVAYQDVDGQRVPVSMAYQTSEVSETSEVSISAPYSFALGDYDPARPLILDPAVIVYCGYIGGSGDDTGNGIAVDSAGNAYVTGNTTSTEADFPVTGGPDLTYNGNGYGYGDAFVAKVNAAGTALVYASYIGGSDYDIGMGIAVDSAGNAYVTGETYSTQATFPVTVGPDLTYNGGGYYYGYYGDAFVAKVNAAGTALTYAGYIGGSGEDVGYGITVDNAGNAYVTGFTDSTQATFPVIGGPDLTHNDVNDAFVVKVNAAGTALVYAGYIGGSAWDEGNGIAVDNAGNAYVTGFTGSTQATFPVTGGPDLTHNGYYDAFVAKVNPAGTALVYAGYIGGLGEDRGYGIAVDSAGNAYVTGYTGSTQATFPVTGGPDLTYDGGTFAYDAFVAKINAAGTALVYAGYIGGSSTDCGRGIAVDSAGNAYVTGFTDSTQASFPVTGGPDLTYNGGADDAFVAKVNAAGTALVYAGYIGGSIPDYGYGIAVDSAGNAYVAGSTWSSEASFPVTGGPDLTYNSGGDAFVAKVDMSNPCPLPDGMCAYHGDLHSHTSYSDGVGTPGDAYQMARANGLDFFALTDHSSLMDATKWSDTLDQAMAATQDGKFVALRGFEWGGNGHINVFGTDTFVNGNDPNYDSLDEFYAWLADPAQTYAVAQFNHPNRPPDSFDTLRYEELADAHINLIEVGNSNYLTHTIKYNPALAAGWHVAPTNNSDTHTASWGERIARTGIVAPGLTYYDVINSLRARRTFSTEDADLTLAMRAAGSWMGSVLRDAPRHFEVYAIDPEPGDPIATLEFYQNGTLIESTAVNTNDFIWNISLSTTPAPGAWWYVKAIQSDGDVAYTSPIWTFRPKQYDVLIRDNIWDDGDIPSPDPSWQSPDIWIRHEADGQLWHQNPAAGQTNQVYAVVQNVGTDFLTDVEAYFYWAKPSLGFVWPDSWNPINSAPIHIQNLAPGKTATVNVPWDVPSTAPEHTCLFVRLVSTQDPIRYEGNAKWDNNIGWRNIHIVGTADGQQLAGLLAAQDITLYLTNPFTAGKTADVHIASGVVLTRPLTIRLTTDLFDRWMSTGLGGSVTGGVIDPIAKIITITRPTKAMVYGLPMLAGEISTATLTLEVPANSTLAIQVSEQIEGEEIGGNLYTTFSSNASYFVYLPVVLRKTP
jgi:predicted metal-dependent phosphoesterase TrpH